MDNPHGRVLAVDLAKTPPSAKVEVTSAVSCERCAAGKGCGAGLIGASGGNRSIEARIAPGITVDIGDEVSIELAPRNLLHAALVVYGLPLGGALLGSGVAYSLGLADLHAALAALGGIVAGFLVARRRLGACEFNPTIVDTVAKGY